MNNRSDNLAVHMTMRESIATMLPEIDDDMSAELIARFMGIKMPEWNKDIDGYIRYMAEYEAKRRVIRADKLIAELSKPQSK